MRLILKCDKYERISNMLHKLHWLSVRQMVEYGVLTFIHNIKLGGMPAYYDELFWNCSSIHDHNTRNKDTFYVKTKRKEIAFRSVFAKGLIKYNEVLGVIKDNVSIKNFKRALKESYFVSIQQ